MVGLGVGIDVVGQDEGYEVDGSYVGSSDGAGVGYCVGS